MSAKKRPVATGAADPETADIVPVRELNQQTARIMARVRAGHTVVITDRGNRIAQITPIGEPIGLLAQMIADGTASVATAGLPPRPPASPGQAVLKYRQPSEDVIAAMRGEWWEDGSEDVR